MNLLEKVKDLCLEKGISQRKLESELNLSNGSISKWDESIPRADTLLKVANYFEVSINNLIEENNKEGAIMNSLINIENKEGQLIVSSREVASNFKKDHREVIYAIEGRNCSCAGEGCKKCSNRGYQQLGILGMSEKSHLSKMFIETEYKDAMNRTQKQYLLTRDGFTLLAMGFTGQKALEWKLKYIEAFNRMEKAIKGIYHISETALVNNFMNSVEEKLFRTIDERFEKYE